MEEVCNMYDIMRNMVYYGICHLIFYVIITVFSIHETLYV